MGLSFYGGSVARWPLKHKGDGMMSATGSLVRAIGSLAFFILGSVSQAHASPFYETIADSIDSISLQAYVRLEQGRYVTDTGVSRVIWNIPEDTRATVRLKYAYGTIQSGLIDFGATRTNVKIRSGGFCSSINIRRISVLVGGAIDESNSDFIMDRPDNDCRTPRSQLALALESSLSAQINASRAMRGQVFVASSSFRRCPNVACNGQLSSMEPAQPVYEFTTFTSGPNDPGFQATLKEGSVLNFPNSSGYIRVSQGSSVLVESAIYNLRTDQGQGVLRNLSIVATEGVLNFGSNVLNVAPGTRIAFSNLQLKRSEEVTLVENGELSGALGGNSVLTIANAEGRSSIVSIAQAEATLTGLRMEFGPDSAKLSSRSGRFTLVANSADLHLSNEVNLLLGASNFSINFECADVGSNCTPVEWSNNGDTTVQGRILPSAASLRGGSISFPGQNSLQIAGGEVELAELRVNTRNTTTPITGRIQRFEVDLRTQDWRIDENARVGAAAVKFFSDDLELQVGDPYPVGTALVEGQLTELTATGIGRFITVAAQSKFRLAVGRNPRDDMRITDGRIDAQITASGDYDSRAKATLALRDLIYYRGLGSAKLDFAVTEARATYKVAPEGAEQGFPGGRTVVSFTPRNIALELSNPPRFSNVDIRIQNGRWEVPPQSTALQVELNVATGELAYFNVQLGGGDANLPYRTICGPHLNINRGNYVLKANLKLSLSSAESKLELSNFTLQPPFDADVDDRGCNRLGQAICAFAGGAIAGNPLLGIAFGIACGRELDEYKEKMNTQIRDGAASLISNLNLAVGL